MTARSAAGRGSRAAVDANGSGGGGAHDASPGSGPARTSSSSAVSRDGAREHAVAARGSCSPTSGAERDAPARRLEADQAAAGGRDAHRAAAVVAVGERDHARRRPPPPTPPDEPPGVRSRSHGLRVGPKRRGSVTGRMPHSGSVVVPTMTKPAARSRAHDVVVVARPTKSPDERRRRTSAAGRATGRLFLIAIGTPANGRSSPGSIAAAAASAPSRSTSTNALSCGSSASMRSQRRLDELARRHLAGADERRELVDRALHEVGVRGHGASYRCLRRARADRRADRERAADDERDRDDGLAGQRVERDAAAARDDRGRWRQPLDRERAAPVRRRPRTSRSAAGSPSTSTAAHVTAIAPPGPGATSSSIAPRWRETTLRLTGALRPTRASVTEFACRVPCVQATYVAPVESANGTTVASRGPTAPGRSGARGSPSASAPRPSPIATPQLPRSRPQVTSMRPSGATSADTRRSRSAGSAADAPGAAPRLAGAPDADADARPAGHASSAIAGGVDGDRGRAGDRHVARRAEPAAVLALGHRDERRALAGVGDDRVAGRVGRRPGAGGELRERAQRAEAAVGLPVGDDEPAVAGSRGAALARDEQRALARPEVDLRGDGVDAGEIRRALPAAGGVASGEPSEDGRRAAGQRRVPAQQAASLGVEAEVVQLANALGRADRLDRPLGGRGRREREREPDDAAMSQSPARRWGKDMEVISAATYPRWRHRTWRRVCAADERRSWLGHASSA